MSNAPQPSDMIGQAMRDALTEMLVRTMTPELLAQLTKQIVDKMLTDSMSVSSYNGIGQVITKRIHEEIVTQLDLPEWRTYLQGAVREGITQASSKVTEEVKGKILDWMFKSLADGLERVRREGRF